MEPDPLITPDVRAAVMRVLAARLAMEASMLRFCADEVAAASASLRELSVELRADCDLPIATHRDLAELDVQLDALYDI
jgi:hypothetical protein